MNHQFYVSISEIHAIVEFDYKYIQPEKQAQLINLLALNIYS